MVDSISLTYSKKRQISWHWQQKTQSPKKISIENVTFYTFLHLHFHGSVGVWLDMSLKISSIL